jgi:hypothetical protein
MEINKEYKLSFLKKQRRKTKIKLKIATVTGTRQYFPIVIPTAHNRAGITSGANCFFFILHPVDVVIVLSFFLL